MMMASPQRTVVRADRVYTKTELAKTLGISAETLDSCLRELQITPFRAGRRAPQVSGQVYLERVSQVNRGDTPCAQ